MTYITALLILAGIIILYGILLYTTSYIKGASYVNALMLNTLWFLASRRVSEYDIWYPSLLQNIWVNFAILCIIFLVVTGVLMKVNKVRTTLFLTMGTLNAMFISLTMILYSEDFPEDIRLLCVCGFSILVLMLQIGAVIKKKYDRPGTFYSRFFASVILFVLPLALSMLLFIMKNENHRISRNDMLEILLISLGVILIYFVVSSIIDSVEQKKIREKEEREAARSAVRSKISNLVDMQMDKIEEAYRYIRGSAEIVPVHANRARDLYNEAKKIEGNYEGTASGDVLKRLTEIKDEMNRIKRFVVSSGFSDNSSVGSGYTAPQGRVHSGAGSAADNTSRGQGKRSSQGASGEVRNEVAEQGVSAFFNGCESEEEIKKRYHQLCKVFHPDSGSGDEETFVHIREEYDKLLEKNSRESLD